MSSSNSSLLQITLISLLVISIFCQPKIVNPGQPEPTKFDQNTVIPTKNHEKWGCSSAVPLDSVRDVEMNNDNFNRLHYRYSNYLLYVTSDWCDFCCQYEYEINELKKKLKDKLLDDEDIPIVQIHSNTSLDAIKELKLPFWKVPTLYFVRNKEFIQYGSIVNHNNILRWINNIINPVVELKTVAEVEQFMDTKSEFKEKNDFLGNTEIQILEGNKLTSTNRMVAFFSDIEEYSQEVDKFYKNANKISYRYDLRMGIVKSKELITHFKMFYDGQWFNTHSQNAVVIKRNEKIISLDLSLDNEDIDNFMLYNTLSLIDELSVNNSQMMSKVQTPVVVFFIDTAIHLQNFNIHIRILEDIAVKYLGYYIFMFLDGNVKTNAKEKFGYKKDSKMPHLVINYVSTNKQKEFPLNSEYNATEIEKFLDENMNKSKNNLELLKEKQMKSFDSKIINYVKHATKLTKDNFDTTVLNKKYDVVLAVIDTDYEHKSEKLAKYYSRVVDRVKALGFKSLLVATYDINEQGLHTFQNEQLEKGEVYIFPANDKKYQRYTEKLTVFRLMKWIESKCQNKILLPDVPHIDLELQDDYYMKKAKIESYDENVDKSEFEIDDLIDMDFEKLKLNPDTKYDL